MQMKVRPRRRGIDAQRLPVEEARPRRNARETGVLLRDDGVENGEKRRGEEEKRGSGIENGFIATLRFKETSKQARK